MSEIIKIKIGEEEKEFEMKREGKMTVLELPLKIEVAKDSFLHIGAAASPLTEKDAAIFKVDRTPVIIGNEFQRSIETPVRVAIHRKG
jgi:hypothetical protein